MTASMSSDEAVEAQTPVMTSASSSSVSLTSRAERGTHIFDSTLHTRVIVSDPKNIGRFVPFLALLEKVKETCFTENEEISREEYDSFSLCKEHDERYRAQRWHVKKARSCTAR